jgi:formylglycine-generating enzyme required for sulfatase activity
MSSLSSPSDASTGNSTVAIEGHNHGTVNTGLQVTVHQIQQHESGASCKQLRHAYLSSLCAQLNQLPLFAADTGNAQIRLSSVYTGLLTGRTEDATSPQGTTYDRAERHVSALDVLNKEPKLVLLGGPGSGKSTFLSFVALALAGEIQGATPNLTALKTPLPHETHEAPRPQCWDHHALLPLRIVLRDFAAQLPPPGARTGANTLWEFICGQLHQHSLASFAPYLQAELLERGGLVLLDGLDEVPEADLRREQVKQAVQGFVGTFNRCRFAVTSRTYAYQRQDWKLDDFAEAHLLPFAPAQIRTFVDTWYAHMQELGRLSAPEAESRAKRLKQLSQNNERIRELAERPLLLTLIARLQTERGGELPEKREELYDRAVEMLLSQWEEMKLRGYDKDGTPRHEPSLSEFLQTGRDAIRMQLNQLAFEAHRDQRELRGTADIVKARLINALLNANPRRRVEVRVGLLEEFLRDRSGLLVGHGVELYQFPHRSFQEYLAACHLTDEEFPEELARLVRADPNRWREVTLLAGAKAARGSAKNVWLLAEELCPRAAHAEAGREEQWGALLAGQLLAQSSDLHRVAVRNQDKLERVRHWQCWLLQQGTLPVIERTLAGRTLAVLGDPRLEVMTLDQMQFCRVPAGAFVMGSNMFSQEKPRHAVDLTYPYFIARFPVTVAQWRDYLQWMDHAPAAAESLTRQDNEPVVWVSWHEAARFCSDLTARWRDQLPQGWIVTLPSEAEWEKAARGGEHILEQARPIGLSEVARTLSVAPSLTPNPTPNREYPWGESFEPECANVEMSIGEASAVGCFAAGRSPYGCEELSGNVWEWTRSLWGEGFEPHFKYPYDPLQRVREDADAPDHIQRILRGGVFSDDAGLARCAYRGRNLPDNRYHDIGFRVVLRGHPPL